MKGLEPSLLSELEPKSSASANSATSASSVYNLTIINYLWEEELRMGDDGAGEELITNVPCPMPNYMTATRGRRCLKPQRISQEIVFSCSAQSSAEISSFPCSPSKVTTSPSWILGILLTSNIN
jgi:hypothetical protein